MPDVRLAALHHCRDDRRIGRWIHLAERSERALRESSPDPVDYADHRPGDHLTDLIRLTFTYWAQT